LSSLPQILCDIAREHIERHVAAAQHGIIEIADVEAFAEAAAREIALAFSVMRIKPSGSNATLHGDDSPLASVSTLSV